LDNDGPTISIDDVALFEGDSGTTNFVFTASLSAVSSHDVTMSYATADGTAQGKGNCGATNADYISIGTTTLTIPAGQASGTITVLVCGETAVESDETFFVNLTNPVGGTIANAQGLGTILDDDGTAVSIND